MQMRVLGLMLVAIIVLRRYIRSEFCIGLNVGQLPVWNDEMCRGNTPCATTRGKIRSDGVRVNWFQVIRSRGQGLIKGSR